MSNLCPRCGAHRAEVEPAGLCPRCLMGNAIDSDSDLTYSFVPEEPGRVLEVLTRSVGPMPRVLLPDTNGSTDEPPLVRPSSEEMPPKAERSSHVQLLGEIARGGMGAVLKGRDPDLGRDLAVKVLLDTHRGNPDLVRRFVEEAQIGGQLQHPGIVPVYELGTFGDSRPYFTMKLVKGRTLADLLTARKTSLDEVPRFLGIFEQIAQTVAYAHSRGVIHRDLKPSNVMVGSFGEVQVMDWGLAKVLPKGGAADDASAGQVNLHETVIATARGLDDLDLSKAGSAMGTPSYMAPEQARGEIDRIDERADVFALGSILCEILTGRPAFLGRSVGEIQRNAALGDTIDALARLEACGADLDLIALARTCLAREPQDRPSDAGVLSGKVTAYLSSVQEKLRTSERERAVAEATAIEERKRRKLQVGLAASVLALATVGGLAFNYQVQQKQARAATIARALGEATTLRDQALARPDDPARWQTALASVRQAEGAIAQGDPEAVRQLAKLRSEIQAGAEAAKRDRVLLDRLVDIRSAQADDPHGVISESEYAVAFHEAGIDLKELPPTKAGELIKSRPPGVALAIAAALDNWSAIRHASSESAGAKALAEVADKADPDPWRIRFRSALDEDDHAKHKATLEKLAQTANFDELGPISLDLLGRTLGKEGELALSEKVLRQAQHRYPGDVWINHDLAETLNALDRNAEAIRFYTAARSIRPETAHELAHALEKNAEADEAIAVFRDLIKIRPKSGRHFNCLGGILSSSGRDREAIAVFEQAVVALRETTRLDRKIRDEYLERWKQLVESKNGPPKPGEYYVVRTPQFAKNYHMLANILFNLGRFKEAADAYRNELEFDLFSNEARLWYAKALEKSGAQGEATSNLREAIRLDPKFAAAYQELGSILRSQEKFDEALVEYREAIRLDPTLFGVQFHIGEILADQGKHDEAISSYSESIRLRPNIAMSHNNLGSSFYSRGELDKAAASFREAIRLEPDNSHFHSNLGRVLAYQKKHDESTAEYREAIRLDPRNALARNNFAESLFKQGKYVECTAELREAIKIDPGDENRFCELAAALLAQNKFDEAATACREAIRLKPDFPGAYSNLGLALRSKGEFEEAATAYREAIRLKPNLAEAHCNLGEALQSQGDYVGALAMFRKGHELGSRRSDWSYPSAEWVAKAERLAAVAPRLTALLKGDERPRDLAERLILAELGYDRQFHAAAARFWAEALKADPKLGDDRKLTHRYSAACAAALAADGKGKDDPPPDDAAKARLREQALGWLKAELDAWTKLLGGEDLKARAEVAPKLQHWKVDTDLAGIRDPEAIMKLPEAEREPWRTFWGRVDALLKEAGGSRP